MGLATGWVMAGYGVAPNDLHRFGNYQRLLCSSQLFDRSHCCQPKSSTHRLMALGSAGVQSCGDALNQVRCGPLMCNLEPGSERMKNSSSSNSSAAPHGHLQHCE